MYYSPYNASSNNNFSPEFLKKIYIYYIVILICAEILQFSHTLGPVQWTQVLGGCTLYR